MKNVLRAVLGVAALSFLAPAASNAQVVATSDGSGVARFALIAGQNTSVGEVTVRVQGANVVATYATTGGWVMTETQAWIGAALTEIPQTRSGNPTPGQYPYKARTSGVTTQTVTVPLASAAINFACPGSADTIYYLSAHAVVTNGVQTETAWSAGSRMTVRGNWATFSTFTLTCPKPVAPVATESRCETAFARDVNANHNFLDYDFNRWGWSNGPYGAGTYTLDLWAGAGQSDVTKGYLAGKVTVSYNGSIATVTYQTVNGWWLNEAQVYVGSTMFPLQKQGSKLVPTVSPGQYPQNHSLTNATTDTFSFTASGPVYVIAHAVTCRAK